MDREFNLVAMKTDIAFPSYGVAKDVYTYNARNTGMTIRAELGDNVRITIRNEMDEPTGFYINGVNLDAPIPIIGLGQTGVLEFTATKPGTFWYHANPLDYKQFDNAYSSMMGALVIEDPNDFDFDFDRVITISCNVLDEVNPSVADLWGDKPHHELHYFNGAGYMDLAPMTVPEGEWVRLRIVNISDDDHTFHLQNHDVLIMAKDGVPLSWQRVNTFDLDQGETMDILFQADGVGEWLFHATDAHQLQRNLAMKIIVVLGDESGEAGDSIDGGVTGA